MKTKYTYDYIIAGTGCAGLSLAVQLKQSGLKFEKVLLIDQQLKTKNDRTWCFWTRETNNWFDSIIHKRWQHFQFKSDKIDEKFTLNPYEYCLIRGIDFYNYCLTELKNDKRFSWVTESILSIKTEETSSSFGKNPKGILESSSSLYEADYIFNSAIRTLDKKPNHINYVQHFLGWVVETPHPAFDDECPMFMDFDTPQHNDCRFFYIIPQSSTKALVEYTGFSKEALPKEEYEKEIKNYLSNALKITNYTITETEYGEVPMVESAFINPYGPRVINIGTAGGYSKPSTGYTFYFIQRQLKQLITQLKNGLPLMPLPPREWRFSNYDKIFMEVIDSKKMVARDLFSELFKNNKIEHLLAFLNEESTYWEDINIMNSVPKHYFIPATFKKLFS